MKKNADFRIGNIEYSGQNMKFRLFYEKKMYHCFVPGLGKHNVYNATAAIAAAYQFGLDMGEIIERLQSFPQIPQHVEVVKGLNGSTLIDHTWSSNPTSIASSLEVLKNISKGKKKIAVLGEIKFLGDRSKEIHTLVWKYSCK